MASRGGLNEWGDISIASGTINTDTTTTGGAVSLVGYEEAMIVVHSATITAGTFTFSLTECATSGGSYTAVAAADVICAATGSSANGCVLDTTAAHDNAVQIFKYIGSKGYIKVICTSASSANGVLGALVICQKPRHMGVATP